MCRHLLLHFTALLILATFALVADAKAATSPTNNVVWIRYEDLAEHAFSFEAPQSWEVKGGAYRFGYFDVRPMIDIRSPDNKIVLRIFDANVPAYVVPGPHVPPDGQRYDKPGQFQTVVQNYRDAKSFAATYASSRFKSVCQNMTAQPLDWQPSWTAEFREENPARDSDATVSYTCSSPSGPRVALVYAHTALFQAGYGANYWTASPISAVVAPEDLAKAEAVAQHIIDSFHKNPQWVVYQKQMEQAGFTNIQQNFQVFMQQMQQYHNARTAAWNSQVSHYETRQNAQANQVSNWCDTLTGLTNARDPQTGETFKVWTGPYSNYYINGMGNKVNAPTNPGAGYSQMETPPQ
jgi:hypothetical protein